MVDNSNIKLTEFKISQSAYVMFLKKFIPELKDKSIVSATPGLQKLCVKSVRQFHAVVLKELKLDLEDHFVRHPYQFPFNELKNSLKKDLVSRIDLFYTSNRFLNNRTKFFGLVAKTYAKLRNGDLVYFGPIHEHFKERKLLSLICTSELKIIFKISMDLLFAKYNSISPNSRVGISWKGFKLFCSLLEVRLTDLAGSDQDSFLLPNFILIFKDVFTLLLRKAIAIKNDSMLRS
jgi:hypothetical protein